MGRLLLTMVLLCWAIPAVILAQQKVPDFLLPTWQISVAGESFSVELAVSAEDRSRGLMYRESLPDGQGMLFRYDPPVPAGFWMKNVRFSLDLLYFDGEGCLLGHDDRVPPCSSAPCPVYRSHRPTSWVLELPGGTREQLLLVEGDCIPDLRR